MSDEVHRSDKERPQLCPPAPQRVRTSARPHVFTRTERTYYLIFGLYHASWSFIAPVYALFLLDRGLDLLQINAVLATYLITAFLFEVPTGAVADVFGRKVSFLLSCAVRGAAFAMYAFSDSFGEFLVAEVVDAIGTTLATGALDAWAVDGMRAEGDVRSTERFFSRSRVLARGVMILAGIAGGYLATLDLALPWLGGAAGFGVTMLVGAVAMREARAAAATALQGRAGLSSTLWSGVATVRRVPILALLTALTCVTSFAMMPSHQTWQPRLAALTDEGLWIMGWIWALLCVSAMVGSALLPILTGRLPRERVLALGALWRGATLGTAALATGFPLAATGWLLQEMSFGLGEPLIDSWMNEHADGAHRATILSVRAMAFTLGGGVGLICLGLLARSAGIAVAWLVSATIYLATVPACLALGRVASRAAPAPG